MNGWMERIPLQEVLQFIAVFVVILTAAKCGQYLFFEWHTSPAILWPPTGIALAVIWLWGYRYGIPVFLALLVASFTGPLGHLFPAVITTPLGQVIGITVGAYLLKNSFFDGSFSTIKGVLVFLGTITVISMISPTITTLISFLTDNLSTTPFISWSRSWAGYIFSCLILTPLIIVWSTQKTSGRRLISFERILVGSGLLISVYFLFWSRLVTEYSFFFFALFFIAHFWVSLRFSTRALTLSIGVVTIFGILGLFIAPNPERTLNNQLFAAEAFLFLVVPIFYMFSALVKERASTVVELKAAMERIERENLIKNDFIAVLAHELRNPLAPVKSTLEILGLQNLEPETKQLVLNAHQQVHAMRRLLDDLLDITRVTQGKFQLRIERAHLCSMIEHSITSTKELFKDRGHTLTFASCDDSLWLDVDPIRFEQVMVNLLTNAAKYTNPGGQIEISHRVKGKMVEVEVKDNGIGIEQEHLDDIFKPFWQMKTMTTPVGGSIGVGLSLTKHIVEMHKGTIRAISAGPGQGSTFIVSIPLSKEKPKEVAGPVKSDQPIPSYKVVVVDDNLAAANALAKLLTMKGHTVRTVYTGKDVAAAVVEFAPDIILLDIGLPDMSGYEVSLKLRQDRFKGKIIALSGYGQEEDKQKAFSAGCDQHFTKPMSITRFEEYLLTL